MSRVLLLFLLGVASVPMFARARGRCRTDGDYASAGR